MALSSQAEFWCQKRGWYWTMICLTELLYTVQLRHMNPSIFYLFCVYIDESNCIRNRPCHYLQQSGIRYRRVIIGTGY